MSQSENYPLFVYGTLRPGASHFYLLEKDVTLVLKATVKGKLYLYASEGSEAWFPYLTKEEGLVHGELLFFASTEDILAITDGFEDNGRLYNRELYPSLSEDGDKYLAWVYFIAEGMEGSGPLIPSGDWHNMDMI